MTHNVVSGSGSDGIAVREGSLVRGNTTTKNGRSGIAIQSCPSLLVSGNANGANNGSRAPDAGDIHLLGSGCVVRNNVSF